MYLWLSSTTSSLGACGISTSLYGSHRSANQSLRNSLSIISGSSPAACRASYEPASQYRDESGVFISSMSRMTPSASRPNSYLVSTRMSPRSAATPCANSNTSRVFATQ